MGSASVFNFQDGKVSGTVLKLAVFLQIFYLGFILFAAYE